MEDAREITRTSQTVDKAVVIGRLVGIDAAYALVKRGLKVAVVEMAGNILPLQLDHQAAVAMKSYFRTRVFNSSLTIRCHLWSWMLMITSLGMLGEQ